MRTKEEKPIFFRVFGIVVVIMLVNLGGFLYSNLDLFGWNNGDGNRVTGFSIKEFIMNPGSGIDFMPKIFFVLQWFVLGLLLVFVSLKDSKVRLNAKVLKGVKINPSKQHTDLDKLYDLLIERKQLRMIDVSRLFKVSKDVVLEWFKILESGDLAIIDYPMFGGPVIKVEEKFKEGEEDKFKECEKKDSIEDEEKCRDKIKKQNNLDEPGDVKKKLNKKEIIEKDDDAKKNNKIKKESKRADKKKLKNFKVIKKKVDARAKGNSKNKKKKSKKQGGH